MAATVINPPQSTSFRFLDLPAELRNRIYRYTLVSDDKIQIDTSNFAQPSLLQASRQIRAESRGIYYMENHFRVLIHEFDHHMLAAFCRQTGNMWRQSQRRTHVAPRISHLSSSWNNLMRWAADYKEGKVCRLKACPQCKDHGCCLAAAVPVFDIVRAMRDLPWERIEQVLAIHKASSEQQAGGEWKWT